MSAYCELPTFYSDKEVTARKPYKCVECRAPIEKGEKHLSYAGNWPAVGGFDSGRQHLLCRDACIFIRDKFQDGDCIGFGMLFDCYREYIGNYDDPRAKLNPREKAFRSMIAKIKWRKRKAKMSDSINKDTK